MFVLYFRMTQSPPRDGQQDKWPPVRNRALADQPALVTPAQGSTPVVDHANHGYGHSYAMSQQ
jgi:hypothetical protein